MGLINVGTLASNGDTANATDFTTPINTIVNDYNGNIDNNNIAAAAAIADTKLAQITTASKVSTSAITGTYSNIVSTCKIGKIEQDLSTTSSSLTVTGVGFKPSAVHFMSAKAGTVWTSKGFDNGTNCYCILYDSINTQWSISETSSIVYFEQPNTPTTYAGSITALTTDGFTIDWIRTGTPTGTLYVFYTAFK